MEFPFTSQGVTAEKRGKCLRFTAFAFVPLPLRKNPSLLLTPEIQGMEMMMDISGMTDQEIERTVGNVISDFRSRYTDPAEVVPSV